MTVDALIDDIIAREGGFVNDPDDPGGPTKYGITQATLAAYLGRPVSAAEVEKLGRDQARAIYRARYYDAPGLGSAPQALQPFLLDTGVNQGPGEAIRMLQRVLADTGADGLAIDGAMGPQTAQAAQAALARMGNDLLASLADERRRVYFRLVSERPRLAKFLAGWLARANAFDPDRKPDMAREQV